MPVSSIRGLKAINLLGVVERAHDAVHHLSVVLHYESCSHGTACEGEISVLGLHPSADIALDSGF